MLFFACAVWRLPLRRGARERVIVPSPPMLPIFMGVWVVVVVMLGLVVVVMVMVMVVMVMVVMMPRHAKSQNVTGRLMIDLWDPSLPWATMEPSASTTTRTPINAVMSEVS
jgi:hypothetical protein